VYNLKTQIYAHKKEKKKEIAQLNNGCVSLFQRNNIKQNNLKTYISFSLKIIFLF
jgi:hypothetical protein